MSDQTTEAERLRTTTAGKTSSASFGLGGPHPASSLAPALTEALDGNIRDFRWFRADWQRGGAATARAIFLKDSAESSVVVKLPVTARELRWTRRLHQAQRSDNAPVTPRLLAGGDALPGYDLAWIVIEDLPHGPLGAKWSDSAIPRMADAAARLHAAASTWPVDVCPMREDWDTLLREARDSVKTNPINHAQRWKTALKALSSQLDRVVEAWRARPTNSWIHGDLHPANAMCRSDAPDAPVALIDLAEVRPGHWVEDAVYLERLLWTSPNRLRPHKPLRELQRARRELGLDVDDDSPLYAAVRRVLLAATAPRFMQTEGTPAHLEACLSRVEAAPAELKKYGL